MRYPKNEPARNAEQIAELLVKCQDENDDRIGQTFSNALSEHYGRKDGKPYFVMVLCMDPYNKISEDVLKKYKAHDIFHIEDDEMLNILKAYYIDYMIPKDKAKSELPKSPLAEFGKSFLEKDAKS